MNVVSEYMLPHLPNQVHSILPVPSQKKTALIKSVPKTPTKPIIPKAQTPISVFVCPMSTGTGKKKELESRKSSLLERIKARQAITSDSTKSTLLPCWERGEWCISSLFQ